MRLVHFATVLFALVLGVTAQTPSDDQIPRATAVGRGGTVQKAPATQRPPLALPGAPGATFRPGDMFLLRLTGMPAEFAEQYRLDFTIGGDGFINIPLAGQVRAAGLTQSQLERAIEKKLIDEEIFRWPTATINVSPGARFVTIGGNVRQPNRLAWTADLTVLSAISACGGQSDFAGDRINLIRSGQFATYSYKKLKRNPADDPPLNPGDQVDMQ